MTLTRTGRMGAGSAAQLNLALPRGRLASTVAAVMHRVSTAIAAMAHDAFIGGRHAIRALHMTQGSLS